MHSERIAFGDSRVPARLWSKVQSQSSGCWLWTGARWGHKKRYGAAWYENFTWRAHRLFFSLLIRPVESTEHVHHDYCRNELCVNPTHLKALPQELHWGHGHADKTHCPQGHEYTPENTYVHWRQTPKGTLSPNRSCRACARERYQAQKAKAA